MTQVGQLFTEEKEKAVVEAIKKKSKDTIVNMLKDGIDEQSITKYVPGYSLNDVLQIKKEENL